MAVDLVLGVDACRGGWVGVLLGCGPVEVLVAPGIELLVERASAAGRIAAVGIDIPIGLPDAGVRQADLLARQALGPRRASLFVTPCRAAMELPEHAEASAVNRALTGAGISRQAHGLREKVLDVDAWVRRTRLRVVEVHPELSFAQMAGAPLPDGKRTWAGAAARHGLLRAEGIELAGPLRAAGRLAAVDDVLDAGAAAWSARRVASGEAQGRPDPPEVFGDGLPASIWT